MNMPPEADPLDDDILPLYCRNCKKVIARDVAFCSACGHNQRLPAPPAPGQAVPPREAQATYVVEQTPSAPNTPTIDSLRDTLSPLGLVLLPAALLIGLGLVLFVGGVIVNFWPVALGVVVGVVCFKHPKLTEQNRTTAVLVSLTVGAVVNVILLTADSL